VKAQLVPGAEIDFATPADVAAIAEAIAGLGGTPDVVRMQASGMTTAAGFLELVVYAVPPGQSFILTRTIVEASGFTPGVPFTGAGAYLDILRNDVREDFVSLAEAPGLPAISTDSETQGAVFQNGDQVIVRITGGPATTSITARIRGSQRANEPSQG
jgi:hypothetical protein